MAIRSTVLSVLLLSADPELHTHIKLELHDAAITVAKDWDSVSRIVARKTFDLIILETKRGLSPDLAQVQRATDPARTCILAGPRTALRKMSRAVHDPLRQPGPGANGFGQHLSLESYVEGKIADFVKHMKSGAARNLHPMLIQAVERPLLAVTLKETRGNQIKAAHLLGMNRNTLRKKIAEFGIAVRREKAQAS